LVQAEEKNDRLPEDELLAMLFVLLLRIASREIVPSTLFLEKPNIMV